MKLLLLVDWSYPCDHQFLTEVYAKNFIDKGHELTWVMRPQDPNHQTIEYKNWNDSEVYILPSSAYNPGRDAARFFTGRIQSNPLFKTDIDFTKFDLVHVRNDLSMGLAACYLANEFELPYVHQISHLKANSLIEEAKQGFNGRTSWIKGHLGKKLRRYVANSSDMVLPISDAMKRYLQNNSYTTPMQTLPTGAEVVGDIPTENILREKYGIDEEYVLLYMGSMSPSRKLEFLFDVLNVLEIDYDVNLVMVGGRLKSNRERLKQAANKKGVSDIVKFTGWVSDRVQIQSAIATADVGLSPLPTDSVLSTNAPIKTLEYMSLGTPVVASTTPDQQDVLKTSRAGLAVDYKVKSFVDAIDELLSSEERRNRMGKRGRDYIRNNRNFGVLSDLVEDIYNQVIRENKNE